MCAGDSEPEDESESNVCAAASILLPLFVRFSALCLARQQSRHYLYAHEFHAPFARSAKSKKAFPHRHFLSWSVRWAGSR